MMTALIHYLQSIFCNKTFLRHAGYRRSTSHELQRTPMVIDTDAGFDDMIAIIALHNTNSDICLITTVGGIQDCPIRGAHYFKSIFPEATVVSGSSLPASSSSNSTSDQSTMEWLLEYRKKLNSFIAADDDSEGTCENARDNSRLPETSFREFLRSEKDNTVDLMCLGPLTNISSFVKSEEISQLIKKKIRSIWIMGGNIPQQSHDIKSSDFDMKPEFNFAQDPIAAEIVLSSSIICDKLFLLPAQACIDVDQEAWSNVLEITKSRNDIISQILQSHPCYGHVKYDPVCAFAYANSNSASIKWEVMNINVDPKTGLVRKVDHQQQGELNRKIKVVTCVDHTGDTGFISWLSKLIELEDSSKS